MEFPKRKKLRIPGFDYSRYGPYFVTICTRNKKCFFGQAVDGEMRLNAAGRTVKQEWEFLTKRSPSVALDAFIVMPNHFHGILAVGGQFAEDEINVQATSVGAQFIEPETCSIAATGAMNCAPTLGKIIRAFKAASSRQIRKKLRDDFAWQRNYYEHIIRDEAELDRIREYVFYNASKWETDRENPDASKIKPAEKWMV